MLFTPLRNAVNKNTVNQCGTNEANDKNTQWNLLHFHTKTTGFRPKGLNGTSQQKRKREINNCYKVKSSFKLSFQWSSYS